MSILDIIILLVILLGGFLGFKKGGIKTIVSLLGLILVILASFSLKNVISKFLYLICPFFEFTGVLEGITVINILLYEVIAFIIVFIILYGLLKIVILVSGLLEKILKMTIILSIPSKIIGLIVGLIENYVIIFVILYFVTLPFFNINFINESTFKDKILYNTPILSNYVKDNVSINTELIELIDKYKDKDDQNSFNLEALELMLRYDIVDKETVIKLVERNKLQIDYIYSVLDKEEFNE